LSISIDHFLAEFKQIAQEKGVIFWPRPENISMSILGLTRSIVTTDILLNFHEVIIVASVGWVERQRNPPFGQHVFF